MSTSRGKGEEGSNLKFLVFNVSLATALILYMCKATQALPFSEQIFSFPSKFLAEFWAISSELVRTSCAEGAQSRNKAFENDDICKPKSANYTRAKKKKT